MSGGRKPGGGQDPPCLHIGSGELWELLETLPAEVRQLFIDGFFRITLRVGLPELRRGYAPRRLSAAEYRFITALTKGS